MERFMERVTDIIARYPDRKAFVEGEETITYRELDVESAKVYRYLKSKRIEKEQFITIIMPKNVHFFSCVLGCWKAGVAYVLIEEGYPEERITFIRKDSNSVLTVDFPLFEEIQRNCEPLGGFSETDLHDAAYAVYTSGSTGTPKGVLHEYGNIDQCAAVTPVQEEYPEYIFGFTASLNFVAMQLYIIDAVVSAKTTVLISGQLLRNFNALQLILEKNRVERVFLPPSFLLHYKKPSPYLRTIYTGSAPANDIFYPEGPEVMNTYGMSETGFFVLQTLLDKAYSVAPVGTATLPIQMVLLQEDEAIIDEPFERGELCIQNDYVRGYMNLPERTKQAFRQASWDPELRLFHTGDIAYRDEKGMYYIAGRMDDMIKIDGNRIEPAEIEAAVKRITGLDDIMARGFQEKKRAYTAVYFLEEEAGRKGLWDGRHFSIDWGKLTKLLPYYMLPAYFVNLKEFPKNANGKFVRKDLPVPDSSRASSEYTAPTTPMQKKLCSLFETVLSCDKVGIHDDFYALGGDSLSTMELISFLDVPEITAMDIFRERTPEKIASAYEEAKNTDSMELEEKERESRENTYPLTGFQTNMFDTQLYAPQTCMWNIPILFSFAKEEIDARRLLDAVGKTVDHVPVFRTVLDFDKNGMVIQKYQKERRITIELEHFTEAEFEQYKKELNQPFRLIGIPLISLRLFETDKKIHLFLYAHHIVIDGSSINVLLSMLWDFYDGKQPATDTWFSWLDEESKIQQDSHKAESDTYFEKVYGGKHWCRNLRPDNVTRNLSAKIHTVSSGITGEVLQRIKNKYNLSPNELSAAIALLALSETEKEENVMANWVFQNRLTKAGENAVGLLIRLLPVGVTIREGEGLEEILRGIGSRIREGIARSDSNWCLDHENVYLNDALFIVYESTIMDIECMKKRNVMIEFLPNPGMTLIRRTSLQIVESDQGLVFHFFYVDEMYEKEHIGNFLRSLEKWIRKFEE